METSIEESVDKRFKLKIYTDNHDKKHTINFCTCTIKIIDKTCNNFTNKNLKKKYRKWEYISMKKKIIDAEKVSLLSVRYSHYYVRMKQNWPERRKRENVVLSN